MQDKIEMSCSKCGTRLKFSPKFLGRMGMCVACGEQFIIKPEASAEPKKPSTAVKPPGKASTKFNFKISTYFKKPPKA